MMSDAEYVAAGGMKCPHCGSNNIEAVRNLDMEGTTCYQDISCGDCERTWIDVYKLIGWHAG